MDKEDYITLAGIVGIVSFVAAFVWTIIHFNVV